MKRVAYVRNKKDSVVVIEMENCPYLKDTPKDRVKHECEAGADLVTMAYIRIHCSNYRVCYRFQKKNVKDISKMLRGVGGEQK